MISHATAVDLKDGALFLVADCAEEFEVGIAGELDVGGGEGGGGEGDAGEKEDDDVGEGRGGGECEGVLGRGEDLRGGEDGPRREDEGDGGGLGH